MTLPGAVTLDRRQVRTLGFECERTVVEASRVRRMLAISRGQVSDESRILLRLPSERSLAG